MIGCEYVGAGCALKTHLESCVYCPKPPKEIKCPYVPCKKNVSVTDIVEHLKNEHKAITVEACCPGKFIPGWFNHSYPLRLTSAWHPTVIYMKEKTFFLQTYKNADTTWKFWVTILGSKYEADKYDFKISVGDGSYLNVPRAITFRGKIFSTDEIEKHPIYDNKYVLKLDNCMVEIRSDGNRIFNINYLQIIKKDPTDVFGF